MKKFLAVTISILLIIAMSITVMATAFTTSPELQSASVSYYPVITTEEWKTMGRSERVAACQLSDADLAEISTKQLLQMVIAYPFMIDIFLYDNYTDGFNHVFNEYPALAVLAEREDFGEVLLAYYDGLAVVKDEFSYAAVDSIRNFSIIEVMIAQPKMRDNLTETELIDLYRISEKKYYEKETARSIYGASVVTFYDTVKQQPDLSIDIPLAASGGVRTPNGTPVQYIDTSGYADHTAAKIAQINRDISAAYPAAVKLREPTNRYNCHSYAWYSISRSNTYWISNPSAYMTDGSYNRTTQINSGNIAYWSGTNAHSGIVLGMYYSELLCESKWGSAGLYQHDIYDCPYNGQPISYWTR